MASTPINDNIFFVYCAPDSLFRKILYVSGTEKTAIVISDVTTLLLIILASCFVAAAPETADFPDIPRIALTIVCAVLYPIDFTIYVLSGIRLCVKVVLATCCANMCAKNDNPNT